MKKVGLFTRDRFVTVPYELSFPDLPASFDGFRLTFLSDLHGKTFGPGNEELLRGIFDFSPDAVLIGGDMMVVKPSKRREFSALEALLEGIGSKLPVYYAEGNHEHRMKESRYEGWYGAWEALLQRYGVHCLSDRSETLVRNGKETITVAGLTLPKKYYRKFRKEPLEDGFIRKTLGERQGFTVLLLHSPAYFDEAADWGADLTLSGHYHGGTVRLGKRGLMTPDFIFFEKRVQGIFKIGEKKLAVSAGLGTHSVNLRIGDPPELVNITLRKTV